MMAEIDLMTGGRIMNSSKVDCCRGVQLLALGLLSLGIVALIAKPVCAQQSRQSSQEVKVGVTKAVLGKGSKAKEVTPKLKEIVAARKAITIRSKNLGIRGKKGSRRSRLRINYVVNGRPGSLELEQGIKVNIYDEILKHDKEQADIRQAIADETAIAFATAWTRQDGDTAFKYSAAPFMIFDGQTLENSEYSDKLKELFQTAIKPSDLPDNATVQVKRRLFADELPLESFPISDQHRAAIKEFIKQHDQILYLETKVTGSKPNSLFAVVIRRLDGKPRVIAVWK